MKIIAFDNFKKAGIVRENCARADAGREVNGNLRGFCQFSAGGERDYNKQQADQRRGCRRHSRNHFSTALIYIVDLIGGERGTRTLTPAL